MVVNKIGFLLHSSELVNHYGCICEKMDRDSFDFIFHNMPPAEIEFLIGWCDARKITYTFIENLTAKYKILVTNHCMSGGGDQVYLPEMVGVFNVRFMYALGKDAWHFADWNNIYDLILCYGPYQEQNLRHFERPVTLQIGYPRYDDFFNLQVDREQLAARLGCDTAKETILWLPTWKQLCSLDETYIAEISKLTRFFNVMVKPHPLTSQCFDEEEAAKMSLLRSHKFTRIIDTIHDNSDLFRLADYVIADYGGSSFGAIYTDRNLILLDVNDAHDNANIKGNSSEFILREQIKSYNHDTIKTLIYDLMDEGYWLAQRGVRQQLRDQFFAPYYGSASKMAAHILSLLNQKIQPDGGSFLAKRLLVSLKDDQQLRALHQSHNVKEESHA